MSKYKPSTRAEFKEKVLRQLGAPAIKINVSDDHLEDCVEEALKWYYDYHFDGSEHTYLRIDPTPTDITNRYVEVPDDIIGVNEVYTLNTSSYSIDPTNMWNGGWDVAYNFAYNTSTGSMSYYYINRMNLEMLQQVLFGKIPIRFQRHNNRVYIDFNWGRLGSGESVILDCYKRMDPSSNPEVWDDRWLLRYTAAKVKAIWGSVLGKFEGVQMPGGIIFNGNKLRDDAVAEIHELEQEMLTNYSIPVRDMIA